MGLHNVISSLFVLVFGVYMISCFQSMSPFHWCQACMHVLLQGINSASEASSMTVDHDKGNVSETAATNSHTQWITYPSNLNVEADFETIT